MADWNLMPTLVQEFLVKNLPSLIYSLIIDYRKKADIIDYRKKADIIGFRKEADMKQFLFDIFLDEKRVAKFTATKKEAESFTVLVGMRRPGGSAVFSCGLARIEMRETKAPKRR